MRSPGEGQRLLRAFLGTDTDVAEAKLYCLSRPGVSGGHIRGASMFGIGMTELMVILVIGLLVIGPKKLPGLARSLGKSLAEFRRASDDMRREFLDVSQSAQIDPAFENPRDANAESAPGATAETSSDSAPDSAPDSQTDSETESGTDTRTDAKTDVTAKADDGG